MWGTEEEEEEGVEPGAFFYCMCLQNEANIVFACRCDWSAIGVPLFWNKLRPCRFVCNLLCE